MKTYSRAAYLLFVCLIAITSCKKKDAATPAADNTSSQVLNDFVTKVAYADYTDLATQSSAMYTSVQAFIQSPSADGLNTIKKYWLSSRQAYEQSEAFIFGPTVTPLDPQMDSWPVNRNDLDSLIKGSHPFDSAYIASLPETLKGFHALEYLLFGANGNRANNTYSSREKGYMLALAANLQYNANQMKKAWNPEDKTSFGSQLYTAGTAGNTQYSSEGLALQEIANAMADIVEEVGEEKMKVPFVQRDSLLEESHFSRNSFADFANNMRGVKNAYLCKYGTTGTGMNVIVGSYNKALDTKLQQQMDNAINVFTTFTVPFGDAIYTQPGAIQNAENVLDELHTTIEDELVPLIKAHVK